MASQNATGCEDVENTFSQQRDSMTGLDENRHQWTLSMAQLKPNSMSQTDMDQVTKQPTSAQEGLQALVAQMNIDEDGGTLQSHRKKIS